METLGERFAYFREKRGLSQDRAAELSGVSKNHIYAIEKNLRKPSLEIAMALADTYKAKIEDIYKSTHEVPPRTSEEILAEYNDAKKREALAEVRLIPIKGFITGTVSAGCLQEEPPVFEIDLPSSLSDYGPDTLRHFRVSGNSLAGDNINDKDIVSVQMNAPFVDDKIYLVDVEGQQCFRHVTKVPEGIKLSSSNPAIKDKIVSDEQTPRLWGRLISVWKCEDK